MYRHVPHPVQLYSLGEVIVAYHCEKTALSLLQSPTHVHFSYKQFLYTIGAICGDRLPPAGLIAAYWLLQQAPYCICSPSHLQTPAHKLELQ